MLRVTEIIGSVFPMGFADHEAMQRGTEIHEAISSFILNGDISDKYEAIVRRYAEWHELMVEEVVAVEERFTKLVGSNCSLAYTGQPDLLAVINDELTLIDFKTGGESKSHRLQTIAYCDGWPNGHRIAKRGCLYTDGMKWKEHDRWDADRAGWLAACELKKWKDGM